MEYSGNPINQIIKIGNDENYFHLLPFIPTKSLTKSINNTIKTGWPLLIIGDKLRANMLGKIIAYDLYGDNFQDYIAVIRVTKKQNKFKDFVYTYDYETRSRDIDYYSKTNNENFLKPLDTYLQKGPIIHIINLQNDNPSNPILLINDLHNAEDDFIIDLMEFFLTYRSIYIHDTQEEIHRIQYKFPIIILNADKGYKLPNNYDGVIYTHNLEVSKEHLLKETMLQFSDRKIDGLEVMVEKIIALYDLLSNNTLISMNDSDYPGSLLELLNTIELKIQSILSGEQKIEEIINEIDKIIQSQQVIGKHININDAVKEIINLISSANMSKAMGNLKILKDSFPVDFQTRINVLLSNYNELKKIESLGIESTLTLWPKQNKLKFDILLLLEEVTK